MSPIARFCLTSLRRLQNKAAAASSKTPARIGAATETGAPAAPPAGPGLDSAADAAVEALRGRLSADVGLAADHVDSIRALLEVSQAHQQAIPRAAFQNLELVSKHLRSVQRELEAGQTARRERPGLRPEEAPRALPGPARPRLQPLSFECRASPSDR